MPTHHYRAELQPGHEVATQTKAASSVMERRGNMTLSHAWAIKVEKHVPAHVDRWTKKQYPAQTGCGTIGGFAGSEELARKAVAKELAVSKKWDPKGTTKVAVWSEVIPLEVII